MSEKYPKLAKAPITEALIDIRLKLPRSFNVDNFKSIGSQIRSEYPKEKTIYLHEAKISYQQKEQNIAASHIVNGYRYESSDGAKIVQLREDGFTFNRLKPYDNWLDIRDESLRLWNFYNDLVKPEYINRIALRYINNLNAPLPMNDFKDYLSCPPEVPEGLPQVIRSFFYRVIIPHSDARITAIITQALEAKVDIKDKIPIILDIDVFKMTEEGFLREDMVVILEKLREFKNLIFFSSITPKLLETYK